MSHYTPIEPAAALRRCAFFSQLDDGSLAKLAAMAQKRTYERGRVIAHQNDEPAGMFIVASGQVRVYKIAPNGKEHVLHLAGAGQTFLEVAVLGDFPAPAFCEAVDQTVCILLPGRALRRALAEDHLLCRQILASMAHWVKHLVNLLEDIVLRDAVGRVARHVLEAAASADGAVVELPAMKKDLASHLNLTSETLSRTLRRLHEAGIIDTTDRQALRVLKPGALADAAEGAFPHI